MIVDDKKILFFLDVMPSEQGSINDTDLLFYTNVFFSGNGEKIKDIKEYKDCSKYTRKQTSQILCELIGSDKLWINARAYYCRGNIALENGKQLLSEITNTDKSKINEKTEFIINNQKLNYKRALMYANYAIVLSLFSINMSSIMKSLNKTDGNIILDFLPGDQLDKTKQPGLELVKWITDNSEFLNNIWRESAEFCKAKSIGFAYAQMESKIGFALSDWIAQSIHACANAESFRANIKSKREIRRRLVADIFFAILEQFQRHNLDHQKILKEIPRIRDFKWKNN